LLSGKFLNPAHQFATSCNIENQIFAPATMLMARLTERYRRLNSMAEQYTLEAQPRSVLGKQVKALRRENLVPAVIYGAGGDPINVMCAYRPLEIVLKKAGGTHLINVTVDGTTHNALVREVQRDKIKRTIQHVDFMRVDLTKKIRAEVPLTIVGIVKLPSDVQLAHNVTSITVLCLPTDIPDHIEVDVRNLLSAGDQMTVGDLPRIGSVDFLSDPHEVVARIDSLTALSADDAAAEAAASSEPEVIEKGKKEEEDF
jgi:large subunit ribosomal protein L25